MKHLHLLFLMAFSLCVISCSSDDVNETSDTTGLYLSRQVTVSPFGGLEVNVTYNEQKMPSGIEFKSSGDIIYYELYYNSQGKLVSSLIYSNDQLAQILTYEYNALGQLSLMSTASMELPVSINNHTYTINYDVNNTLIFTFDDAQNLVSKSIVTDNGNSIETKNMSFTLSTDKGAFYSLREYLLPLYLLASDELTLFTFDTMVSSNINLSTDSPNINQNFQLQLDYLEKNDEGFPTYVERNLTETGNNQSTTSVLTFNTYIRM